MPIARLSTAAAAALATALAAALDAGSGPALIQVYAGTLPASADTAITDQTLLGTLTCADPCGSVSAGTLTLGPIAQDAAADASGTASFARLSDSAGQAVMDIDITATTGTGALKLNTVTLVAGGPIAIDSFVVVVG